MLLRLIPLHESTVIHVAVTYPDLPQSVVMPLVWSGQHNHLVVEGLEVPNTVYSFDKAAGITSLLEEVTFDVRRQEVRCKFVEGGTEEWSFHRSDTEAKAGNGVCGQTEGRKLLAALEGIVSDVRASTEQAERALLEREKERQRVVRLERSKSVTVKPGTSKIWKHRKQRSMFMQIVSSIGSTIANLTSPSSSTSLPSRLNALSSPACTNLGQDDSPPPTPGHPETASKYRTLRRAARAALVDAFRRFVLSELTRRLPTFSYCDLDGNYQGVHGGGFCVWILHSMRRRAQERIDQLFEDEQVSERRISLSGVQALIHGEQMQPETGSSANVDRLGATFTVGPSIDDDDTATETDGSSLHTPSSGSHLHFLVRPHTSASSFHSQTPSGSDMRAECQPAVQELDASFPITPSPSPPSSPIPPSSPTSPTFLNSPTSPCSDSAMPTFPSRPTSSTLSQNLTGAALLEYNELLDIRERLWQLAMFTESQNRIAAEEMRNRLEVLTVRSRRRAWSAGQFRAGCGQSRAGEASLQSQYGFSVPFRSSPLRFSCTAEDLEKEYERESMTASPSSSVSAVATFPSYLQAGHSAQSGIESIDVIHQEGAEDNYPLVDGEFDLYEEFPGPSPLSRRGRRNRRRRKDILDTGVGGSMHTLFPVSEELEDEGEEAVDLQFRVALGGGIATYGPMRGRRMERTGRTFMGCDEVGVDGEEGDEKLGQSQETLVDDDGLVDPRDLDIELGFGFDFHQKGGGRGFLGDESVFDEDDEDGDDDEDEDEFKFDLSSQLERPKIRPRMRTSSIFMPKDVTMQPSKHNVASPSSRIGGFLAQPTHASSSHNLPLYGTPLSKSPPSNFLPRSIRTLAPQVSPNQPVLDISRTMTPNISCEPEITEIEIRLFDEHTTGPCPSTHLLNSHHQVQTSTGPWRSVTANAHVMKSLPVAPLPIHMPLEARDDGPEEFTLGMDLPKAAAGGGNGADGTHGGKKWMKHMQASSGRRLKIFGDTHGSLVSSSC